MAAVKVETFGDLLSDFAEKIGETSQNNDNNRKRKVNSAIYQIHTEALWWFDESSDATTTTTTATQYALPTDYRVPHPRNPVKVNSKWWLLIPFSELQMFDGSSGVVQLPQYKKKKRAYIYDGNINFITSAMTSGETITHYYYKSPTLLDETTDTPDIPVNYREAISLLAAGLHLKSQGGREAVEANDYLELYENYIRLMKIENERRRNYGIPRRALDPEEAIVLNQ